VLFPNGDIVFDSPEIAKYLDEKYPETPLNPNNSELDGLIHDYNTRIAFNAFRNAIPDLLPLLDVESQKYFRESREKMLNMTLENFAGDREANTQQFHADVKKIDNLLSTKKFLDGDKPLIHDYILAARIQFFRTISRRTYEELIINSQNENLKRWVKDMDNEFNGYLGKRPTI
jgi:glutathione S-transferase